MIFEVSTLHNIIKKASLTACLLFFSNFSIAQNDASYKLDSSLIKAYKHILNFELNESRILLDSYSGPSVFGKMYLESLTDAIEVFLNEGDLLYQAFEDDTDERIRQLKEAPDSPFKNYYISEIKLHRTLIFLKFGEELSAAWNFRQAYLLAEKNEDQYPGFVFTTRNLGLMHIIIGTTPEKYQWLLNLFGFSGSLLEGINELKQFSSLGLPFSIESDVLLAFVYSYLLHDGDQGLSFLQKYDNEPDMEMLLSYARALILIKLSRSEEALAVLERSERSGDSFLLFYYIRGTILQQKGKYDESTKNFEAFLKVFDGHNYIKDVNFKIGLNYWLSNEMLSAEKYFNLARNSGENITEADKNASFMLEETMPDRNIMKLRLLTDGGFYETAFNLTKKIDESGLESHKDSVEFIYRKARLFHKSGNLNEALKFYQQTIENTANERWYFAPNAALQMGYIYRDRGMINESVELFEKALSYKNHAYKNSIDNEAKAALVELAEQGTKK